MWRTPKTNWQPEDWFNLDPDWLRIRENILYLAQLAAAKGRPVQLPQLPMPGIGDVPTPQRLQAMEQAVSALASQVGEGYEPNPWRILGANFWRWDELNWMETMLGRIKEKLEAL